MLNPGTKLGLYEIVSAIGSGGMGELYQAHDNKLGRDVAIKVLPKAFAHDPQALERFQREARAASALNHPNICPIYEIDETKQDLIAMELLEGETRNCQTSRNAARRRLGRSAAIQSLDKLGKRAY